MGDTAEHRAVRSALEPLPEIDDSAFAGFIDRFASARVVLLGEASHGTAEFYRARAAWTRRLVERHGFRIVALEADWPDARTLDRRVRGLPPPADGEPAFSRFPTWMWRNREFDGFVDALAGWNAGRDDGDRAGIYGLDLYSLRGSMRAVIDYLAGVDPEAAAEARRRYGCLEPWAEQPHAYGHIAARRGYAFCEDQVVEMLRTLNARRLELSARDGDAFLDAAANARLVADAERYYRAMYAGSAESWNVRDQHMFDTLAQLLDAKGPAARAVVWAHNSHIGDARATDMGWSREELNLGQLARERWGEDAALVGFGTHTGTVACASDWDAPVERKRVNPSRPDSWERLMLESGPERFWLDMRANTHLRGALSAPRLERFIGVIYRPETERWSHYSDCGLPEQFDAYAWFAETQAVTPFEPHAPEHGPDELYPSGM